MKRCSKCEIGFTNIGKLESEARVQRHEMIKHTVPCEKCDLKFISMTHRNFHRYFTHEPQCPHCYKNCDGRCSGLYGVAAEKEGRKVMEAMTLDKNSVIEETERTVEKMVEEITVGKVELAQKYATYIDVGHIDCESDVWSTLLYYPSPEMPKRSMSEYTRWWTFMDLYMSALDRLTDCLKTVKIQRCKCGYSVIFFYGHIMQHHHEFIKPDGTIGQNTIAELQDTRTDEQISNPQEGSNKASTKMHQVHQDTKHVKTAKTTQN